MDWRCTDCGRVRETRSEPCECGAHSFERADLQHSQRCTECGEHVPARTTVCPECGFSGFEPITDGTTAGDVDSSYDQWRCTECGRTTPRNTPPCGRCGNMTFERERVEGDEFDVDAFVGADGGVNWRLVATLVAILVVVFLVGRLI